MSRVHERTLQPYAFAATVLAVVAAPIAASAQASTGVTEEPLVVRYDEVQWSPPSYSNPRSPQGLQTAQLGRDPDNGGPIYLARFPAGTHFDLHWHTHAEYVVVMEGRVTIELGEATHELDQGAYVVIPERMPHSWDVPQGGDVVILVRRRGPADFNYVDP